MPIYETPCSKLTTELPPKLFEAIGRVIVVYSSIEQEVRNIIYSILKISPAEGRVAITNPDTANNLSTIEKLLKINGIETPPNFREFKKEMQDLVEIRNWLSHGVWTQIDGKPYLQITHAKDWKPNDQDEISRKIVPVSYTHLTLPTNREV